MALLKIFLWTFCPTLMFLFIHMEGTDTHIWHIRVSVPSMCMNKHINAIGKNIGGVYSMVLSTWNFEYASALQSMKTISFHNARHPMSLFIY